MQKTIRVFSVLSVVIRAMTVFSLLLIIAMQNELLALLKFFMPENIKTITIVPVDALLQAIFSLGAAILLCIAVGKEKSGIALEIIFAAITILVLPGLVSITSVLQNYLNAFLGAIPSAKYAYVQTLCNYANLLTPIAQGLSLICCGMSIACKCKKPVAEC